jgi:hypothetical protein
MRFKLSVLRCLDIKKFVRKSCGWFQWENHMLMCHFTQRLKVEGSYLFEILISRNMMGGINASLQNI